MQAGDRRISRDVGFQLHCKLAYGFCDQWLELTIQGVYTGVQARGNGNGGPSSLVSNALRGLQPTGANGTATFITVIPGHYVGRTNHLHSESQPSLFGVVHRTKLSSDCSPRSHAPAQQYHFWRHHLSRRPILH